MAHEGAAPGTPGAAHGPVEANPPGYNPPPPSPVDGDVFYDLDGPEGTGGAGGQDGGMGGDTGGMGGDTGGMGGDTGGMGGGAGAGAGAGGMGGGAGGQDGGMDLERFAERFPGYAYILQLVDPGVGTENSLISIVNQWIADYQDEESDLWTTTTSDADKLQVLMGQMEQSTWYQTFDDLARSALIMEITDSATWERKIEENKEEILRAATTMGIRPSVFERLDELARTSMLEDWTKEELEQELASVMYESDLKPTTGSVKALVNGLRGFSNSQLTPMDDETLWDMAWGIKRGENTLDNAYQKINQSAITEWGLTDFDLHSEYQQNGTTMANRLRGVQGTIAELWDLSPNELNMMDLGPNKLVVVENGKRRLMNSQEAALMARQDDKFLNSNVYKKELSGVGSGLMRMMS